MKVPVARHLPQRELLLLADTHLLWAHRLSEWCGHGPALEEDIALTNTALDNLGQARQLLQLAGQRQSPPRTEDELAYFRDASEFNNLALAEQANGDYAHTIIRSLLLSAWCVPLWEALASHDDAALSVISRDAAKESRVQLRHAIDWTLRLGDGTDDSHQRMQAALRTLWPFTNELLATAITGTDREARNAVWQRTINDTLREATLTLPDTPQAANAAAMLATEVRPRVALLAEMQVLARQHPGAIW